MPRKKRMENRDGLRFRRGQWYFRWYGSDGKRRERALAPDRAVAEDIARKLMVDVTLARHHMSDGEKQDRKLCEVIDCYLTEMEGSRRPSYVTSLRLSLDVVQKDLGSVTVRDITSDTVRAMRKRLQARGKARPRKEEEPEPESMRPEVETAERPAELLSNRTVNLRVGALVGALRWAEEMGVIARNPLPRIAPLPTTAEHRRKLRRSLTAEEARSLLASIDAHDASMAAERLRLQESGKLQVAGPRIPQSPLIRFLMASGLRSNEARSLAWSDIDFPGRNILVRGAVAKNRKEERVDLPDDVLRVLEELRVVHTRLRGGVIPSGRDRVFLTPKGCAWSSAKNLLRYLRRQLVVAGIDAVDDRGRDVDVHSLRVTCGSLLIQAGADLRVVQAHLRHSTPTLTANTYSDRRMVPMRRAVDGLAAVLKATDAAPVKDAKSTG